MAGTGYYRRRVTLSPLIRLRGQGTNTTGKAPHRLIIHPHKQPPPAIVGRQAVH